eukprot:CAMPEP_0114984102 /NCGR_PEP_ID=MMETSP0216-20121206/7080_1 /TAXON_ID=223996 /ORGANISM="Protocruzia adherens, Strain Boccale" /LENGTH=130 /DNA_ID=CAMNT_0002346181 /DNA_START=116 /DNA_END=505 /DNA_ORIENTATION=-
MSLDSSASDEASFCFSFTNASPGCDPSCLTCSNSGDATTCNSCRPGDFSFLSDVSSYQKGRCYPDLESCPPGTRFQKENQWLCQACQDAGTVQAYIKVGDNSEQQVDFTSPTTFQQKSDQTITVRTSLVD